MNLKASPFFLSDQQIDWVNTTLNSMDTPTKAGQLFCLLGGLYSESELEDLIRTLQPGGVLFRPGPAAAVLARHQALDRLSRIPLLKAANLEDGGSGVATDGTTFGNPLLVAAAGDSHQAYLLGEVAALEGAAVGCNWSFGPVVDLALNFRNPIAMTRTFGSNAQRVSQLACEYIQALQARGIAACPKHFPGDGVDDRDQHLHPTVNTLTAQEWNQSFGQVYKAVIEQGVLSMMAGHILLPAFSKLPASLSPELLQGLLRGQLGFNGVITTDATIMAGFTQAMPRRRAVPASVAAGCDVFLFPNNVQEDFAYLMEGIADGTVSANRLDEAVTRILALKAALRLSEKAERPGLEVVGCSQHRLWAKTCAQKAVTLVRDHQGLLPLRSTQTRRVRVRLVGSDSMDNGASLTDCFVRALTAHSFEVTVPSEEADRARPLRSVAEQQAETDVAIWLAHVPVASDQTAVRLWWKAPFVFDLPKFVHEIPTVFLSFASPYHLQDVPYVGTLVNAYLATEAVVEAVVEKLVGSSPFLGTSPVDPTCGYPDFNALSPGPSH